MSTLLRIGPAPHIAVAVDGPPLDGPTLASARAPLIFFLHGIGGSHRQWTAQLAAFSSRYRVAAWDARGYGASDDDPAPLQFSVFADDVVRVLDHLGVARAHLVGLSMGGRIARDVALRYPARLASLTLANTSPGFDALPLAEQQAFVAARAAPLRAGKTPAELAPMLVTKLVHPNASASARAQAIAMMGDLHPESYIKTVEASVSQDRAAPLERITTPTLVIASDADPLYPITVAEEIARRVTGAALVVISQCGHLSNIEQPAAFNAALSAFLEKQHTDQAG